MSEVPLSSCAATAFLTADVTADVSRAGTALIWSFEMALVVQKGSKSSHGSSGEDRVRGPAGVPRS